MSSTSAAGPGRTLRHFLDEARVAEFYGCDIDRPSVAWLAENMSPPFDVFTNDETPPLPLESASFDLVYAISVFTHIADRWSAWLVELHRLLRGGGLLFATIFGPGHSDAWGKCPRPTGWEIEALKHNIRQLHHESSKARDAASWLESQLEAARSVSSRA